MWETISVVFLVLSLITMILFGKFFLFPCIAMCYLSLMKFNARTSQTLLYHITIDPSWLNSQIEKFPIIFRT
jgi:hypothetical protein